MSVSLECQRSDARRTFASRKFPISSTQGRIPSPPFAIPPKNALMRPTLSTSPRSSNSCSASTPFSFSNCSTASSSFACCALRLVNCSDSVDRSDVSGGSGRGIGIDVGLLGPFDDAGGGTNRLPSPRLICASSHSRASSSSSRPAAVEGPPISSSASPSSMSSLSPFFISSAAFLLAFLPIGIESPSIPSSPSSSSDEFARRDSFFGIAEEGSKESEMNPFEGAVEGTPD